MVVDLFGFGFLAGFMWGAARVLGQLMRGGVGTSPQIWRVWDREGEKIVLIWTDPSGAVEKVEEVEEAEITERRVGTWR